MSFVHAFGILPLLVLGVWIVEEIHQVLIHLGLILFHNRQVIAPIGMHTGTPLPLGMHGIGADDASFHQRRMDQRGSGTDLIFFTVHGSLCQDNATLAFIEGEQMHRRLTFALVSERSAQGFPIHRHMGAYLFLLVRLQATGFAPTLFHRSRFEQHAGDRCNDRLCITTGQRLTVGRIGRKALRPVQLSAQPALSFFDPIHNAIHAGFSRQFPQQQQGQEQGQRIASAFLLASVCHLFKGTIQGGRIDGQRLGRHFLRTCQYAKVHVRHFSLS